jgi:hypothetical protein
MALHDETEILKTACVLAKKVIDYSDKCKSGEDMERAEMCLALDDLADLARLLTPDLSDYRPEDDDKGMLG